MGWIGYHLTVGKKKDGNEEKRETERPAALSLPVQLKTHCVIQSKHDTVYMCIYVYVFSFCYHGLVT